MMDFIDRLRPSRVRFATEPEDETKTPFLNRNSAKNGAVVAASRSLYWTMYGFMFATVLLLFAILFQGRGYGLLDAKEYWTKDIIPRGMRYVLGSGDVGHITDRAQGTLCQ
jgi:hypothetical protein